MKAALSNELQTMTFCFHLCNELTLSSLLLSFALALHCGLALSHESTVLAVLAIRAKQPVTPPERRRVVVDERHVVEVVMLCSRPEWNNVLQRPGKVCEWG